MTADALGRDVGRQLRPRPHEVGEPAPPERVLGRFHLHHLELPHRRLRPAQEEGRQELVDDQLRQGGLSARSVRLYRREDAGSQSIQGLPPVGVVRAGHPAADRPQVHRGRTHRDEFQIAHGRGRRIGIIGQRLRPAPAADQKARRALETLQQEAVRACGVQAVDQASGDALRLRLGQALPDGGRLAAPERMGDLQQARDRVSRRRSGPERPAESVKEPRLERRDVVVGPKRTRRRRGPCRPRRQPDRRQQIDPQADRQRPIARPHPLGGLGAAQAPGDLHLAAEETLREELTRGGDRLQPAFQEHGLVPVKAREDQVLDHRSMGHASRPASMTARPLGRAPVSGLPGTP